MGELGSDTKTSVNVVIQQVGMDEGLGCDGGQRPLVSVVYLSFNLLRASPLLSQLSGSDPGSVGTVVGMVGTGVFGELIGRPEELSGVKG
jgi:hypothetical protein